MFSNDIQSYWSKNIRKTETNKKFLCILKINKYEYLEHLCENSRLKIYLKIRILMKHMSTDVGMNK